MRRSIALLVLIGLLVACSAPAASDRSDPSAVLPAPTDDIQLVRAAIDRDSPQTGSDQIAPLVTGNTTFAFDLYRAIAAQNDNNLIYSPYSMSLAFSLVYAGARGSTEDQIGQVFHFLAQDEQHRAFNALDQRIMQPGDDASPDPSSGDRFTLRGANAVWGQETYQFDQAYLATLARHYGAGLQTLNFMQQPDQSRDVINRWVAQQTADQINDLMPPDSITPQTRLVLVNAIYFKASWLFAFDPSQTQDGSWTTLDGQQVTVPMMRQNSVRVPYSEGDGYQAVQLPYVGQSADMLIILPRSDQFAATEAQLSDEWIADVRGSLQEYDTTLTMPRFKARSALDLKPLLGELGLSDPFGSAANFDGMLPGGGLFIDAAVHQATISVDEQGTEATAATGIAMAESAYPRAEMSLDRPFIFAIVDRLTGTLLFVGRVMNPAE